jgi:hypothetical protein
MIDPFASQLPWPIIGSEVHQCLTPRIHLWALAGIGADARPQYFGA